VLQISLVVASLLAAPNASASPAAHPSVERVFTELQKVREFHDASISPDGRMAAWSQKLSDADGRERMGAISLAELPSGAPRRLTAAADGKPRREIEPVFSPDGSNVAFLSDAAKKDQLQVYVAPAAASGRPKPLTSVKGQLQELRWSPDGKSLSFLFVEGSEQETGALTAHKRDSGVVEETPEIQRIAIVDVASGRVRSVSPPDLYVYDYDWSPDGRAFAAEGAVGSGTNNYWLGQLYLVDAASGAARSLWKPPLQLASPRFSPDGRTIAVIHGIMSDEGSNGGDVWEVPVAGGPPRNLTPGTIWSASHLAWRQASELLFEGHRDGGSGIVAVDPSTGRQTVLFSGAEKLAHFGAARKGPAVVAIRDSFESAPDVWAGPVRGWANLSRANLSAKRFWGKAESLHWPSDGASVQGWLLYPLDYAPGKKYPMVVVAHGGPSGASTAGWPSRWPGTLPSQGYFVFLPNPRGSFGFGEAFVQGNVKDFGGGDLRDILSGIDAVLARPDPAIDGQRLGIVGWSYGGYMAMWAVTQTNRFAAAVAGAGIASWQSYYGQNKIDTWMLPFFGASVYDDPKVYAKSSPMEFIKKVETPTLVLHGERDSEVPTPQGYEFWHALKALGVPTRLVIYTDEGHSVRKPEHQMDIVVRTTAWFDQYLKASSGSDPRRGSDP
jgi:dipeptidyl aminopeptidase/acylaminoacyl peptidase